MAVIRLRSISAFAIVLVAILAAVTPAAAQNQQSWVERTYDPPVGGRFSLVTEYRRDETTDGKPAALAYSIRSEFTIDGKTGEGYRVTFVNRDMQVSGTTSSVPLMRAVAATLKNTTVRALTDVSGKPLRVENFGELRAVMQNSIDAAVAASNDNPSGKTMLRQILTRLLLADEQQATAMYLGELASLALAQNSDLKPGQERRSIEESPNPLGGTPMRSNQVLKLIEADAATGRARYLYSEEYDPESVRTMIAEGVARLTAAKGRNGEEAAARAQTLLKTFKVTRDEHTEYMVEGGMTRSIRSDKNTTSTGLSVTFVKHEIKTVTVTPLR